MEKEFRKKNGGFSLVELIIVIAIMSILVAVMAPQLLKYIEKTKVEADQNTLDAIYKAVEYARIDVNVSQDSASAAIIESLVTPQKLEDLMKEDTLFRKEVLETLGWAELDQATYLSHLKSAHLSTSEIYVAYQGTFVNPLAMWITNTDSEGKKDTSNTPTEIADIGKCICIK